MVVWTTLLRFNPLATSARPITANRTATPSNNPEFFCIASVVAPASWFVEGSRNIDETKTRIVPMPANIKVRRVSSRIKV